MTTRSTRSPRRRTVIALAVVLAVLAGFIVRLVDIQVVNADDHIKDSLEVAFAHGGGTVLVEATAPGGGEPQSLFFSERHACPTCGVSYPEIAPRFFSFNSPHGACPTCDGLGVRRRLDPALLVREPTKPVLDALAPVVARALPGFDESLTALLTEELRIRSRDRAFESALAGVLAS